MAIEAWKDVANIACALQGRSSTSQGRKQWPSERKLSASWRYGHLFRDNTKLF